MAKKRFFEVTSVDLETWVVVNDKRIMVRSEDWTQNVLDAIEDGWQPKSVDEVVEYVRDER